MDTVADQTEVSAETAPSTNRKMKPWEIVAGVFFTLAVIIGVAEHIAYNDTWSCRTENLEIVHQGMTNYFFNFSGDFLQSEQKTKQFIADMARGKDVFYCNASKKPLLWFPKETSPKGARIVAMCPLRSHGWLRKYAWGIAEKNGKVFWVRIKSDGSVVQAD